MRELERLNAVALQAASGRPSAGLVVAESGLGKTRLLAELVRGLAMPCVQVHGYESARDIPLSTGAGLLRVLSAVPGPGAHLDALMLGAAGAGRTLETLRLFETAVRCLAGFGPLAVVVDDAQWADRETLALLHYLLAASAPAGLPLLVVCATRPSVRATAFASDLLRLLGPERCTELVLGPLDRDDGVDLAVSLDVGLGRDEAELLWRQAQGSPFWLEALTRHDGLEPTPARLMGTRLAGLDPDAGQLFALLVVAAQPMALHDVGQLLGWGDDRLRRAGLRLNDRALVVHDAGTVRIAHDLIREAASERIPVAEQSRLHQRLASWCEADEDIRQLCRALEHRRAAGLEGLDLALRILRSPQRRLLGGEGLATLAVVADTATGPDSAAVQREVAALASELGHWAAALQWWTMLADQLPDPRERAQAALTAAAAAFRLGRAADVHTFAAQALQDSGGEMVVAIEADACDAEALLWLENLVAQAQPIVSRALAAAQQLVERAGSVAALSDRESGAYLRAVRCELDAAIRRADADTVAACAELIQTAARDPADALAAASNRVFSMLQFEGLPRAAEPRARRILDESWRLALPSLEVEATHWAGWVAHHMGRLDEAAELMERAVALATRVGPPRRFTVAQLQAVAHSIDASRGDWQGNVAAIRQAIAAESDRHFRLLIRLLHIGLVGRFAAPDPEELARLLRSMAEDADAAGCGRCLWESLLHAAEVQARIGDTVGATEALERWDATHPEPHGGPAVRRAYIAALLTMHADPAASIPLFEKAAAEASSVGYELMRLWIELDAALACARVDRARGVQALRDAAGKAGRMRAFSEQRLAIHELRALGVRTWRRGPDTRTLTARELEIARLVIAGNSNPEIAGMLFLSRKTVERHVSNVLAKCGARNRTELAHRLRSSTEPSLDAGVPR